MKSYSDRFIESFNDVDALDGLLYDLSRECNKTSGCFECILFDGSTCIYHCVIDRMFELKNINSNQLNHGGTKSFHE